MDAGHSHGPGAPAPYHCSLSQMLPPEVHALRDTYANYPDLILGYETVDWTWAVVMVYTFFHL
jgi:hypothetical protein